jgi:hypothetical protein
MRDVFMFLLGLALLGSVLLAQTPEQTHRARIAFLVERRLEAQQPGVLSAESITYTGKVLHLRGSVRLIWLPDTIIRVDEVKISEGKVELIGNVNASFGSSSGVPLPIPKVQYK